MLTKINQTNQDVYREFALKMYSGAAVATVFDSSIVDRNVKQFINHHDAEGYLIDIDGEFAGYVLLSYMYSTEVGAYDAWLEELYISDAMRGHGLGSKVISALKIKLKGKCARIRLEVVRDNTGAISLYERHGFKDAPYDEMIYIIE